MISEKAILAKIERQPKQAAGFKQLVREMRARGEERRRLHDLLETLVRRGELIHTDGDRYALPRAAAKSKNLVLGRLSMHRDGYGFVTPESGPMKDQIAGDIYISPQNTGNAMHGDKVLVEVLRVKPDARAEGRIARVAGRAHGTVVGTFRYGSRYNYVVPIDEKITQDVVIPFGSEWPEEEDRERPTATGDHAGKKKIESRHRVIGAEARRREMPRHEAGWDDLEGVVVDVEITDWPTPTQNPRGRVIEILGYEDDFGVDTEIIIRKYHLPHRFSPEVLEEAESFEEIITTREVRARRDYRQLPIVTIDGEAARDFDDAVYVERLENGNFELQVHIADVAHYVRDGSEIDREARLRGTSVYFPDRAVPMLPIELSTDICSLRPHVDRLVLSCVMEIDLRGEIVRYEINEGVIRSAERMTYTNVNLILESDPAMRKRYAALVGTFEMMRELAMILNRKRVRRGSIDFDLPEPVIEFDEHGLMKAITRSERNIAHRIIEEFMLSANECVASYLERKQIASLYRIHEKPDPKKIYEFEQVAAAFGYSLGIGNMPVRRVEMKTDRRARHAAQERGGGHRGRQTHVIELPEDVHITPRMYQKLTQKIAGKPEERILSYLMLRSLKQARYSEENVGHFALAAPTYTHFTSPIRRYPDLIVHRILKDVLRDSAEQWDGPVPVGVSDGSGRGTHAPEWSESDGHGGAGTPYRKHARAQRQAEQPVTLTGPIDLQELHEIAEESSDAERRADDAERELMEWKKVKFMQDRVGEEFAGLIVSVTKFGFFVELSDLFIEGLVPLSSLEDDHYVYHENTKQIIGERSHKTYSIGQTVRVLVDRIDRVQKKIQFAVIDEEPQANRHRGHAGRKRRRE